MKIGFTGTQQGMTEAQKVTILELLTAVPVTEIHHGDCIGADKDFHAIVRAYQPSIRIIGHPPNQVSKRAHCEFDETRDPKYYLERNRHIVQESQILFATPGGFYEEQRSGTWSTIRYARKLRLPTWIVLPDGTVLAENEI